ncbi:hypothetical protein [Pseudomonas sp. Pf153]|uniref:hypothetical protein n=1 Tax=Pseudomonas sp. Pf153 TaxID=1699309 RepID=UPI00069E263A|nr:hypothetical protein [Pseudomonas sp. Pf153]
MKHKIMGIIDGDDFATYETTFGIDGEALAKIMNWSQKEDHLYDYELSAAQIEALEKACSIELPSNLLLFLTSSN